MWLYVPRVGPNDEHFYPPLESFSFTVKKLVIQPDKFLRETPKSFSVKRLKRGLVEAEVSKDGVDTGVEIIVDFRAGFLRVTSKHPQITGGILLPALLNDYRDFTKETTPRHKPSPDEAKEKVSTHPLKGAARFFGYLHDLKDRGEIELSAEWWLSL